MNSAYFCLSVLLLGCALEIRAISSGDFAVCDVDAPMGAGTAIMKWVKTAENKDSWYKLESDAGVTSYKPGELVPIHLRVKDLEGKYYGLMMYAVKDGTKTQVGGWEVPKGMPYWTPPRCGGTTLAHDGADAKPLHALVYFKAPPKGTGSVRFRVLIKHGEQGQGNFYRIGQELVLSEATGDLPAQTVFKAELSQSCTEYCTSAGGTCNEAATAAINSASSLKQAVKGRLVCRHPLLAGCADYAPATGDDQYCFFSANAASCTGEGKTAKLSTCSAKSTNPTDGSRFCICQNIEPKSCTPYQVPNSDKSGTGSITGATGASVTVKCNAGFEGGGVVTCGADGKFSTTACTTIITTGGFKFVGCVDNESQLKESVYDHEPTLAMAESRAKELGKKNFAVTGNLATKGIAHVFMHNGVTGTLNKNCGAYGDSSKKNQAGSNSWAVYQESVITVTETNRPTTGLTLPVRAISAFISPASYGVYVASRCIDQDTGNFCHSQENVANPYLRLDLGRVVPVREVKIFNRQNVCCRARLGSYQIWISEGQDPTTGVKCFQGIAPSTVGPFTTSCQANGRYVTVLLVGTGRTLNLAEVEVKGITDGIVETDPPTPAVATVKPCESGSWSARRLLCPGERCKVLAYTKPYETCNKYCTAQGHTCAGAWEDTNNTCANPNRTPVTCSDNFLTKFASTSDMICECKPEKASIANLMAVNPEDNLEDGEEATPEEGDGGGTGGELSGSSALAPVWALLLLLGQVPLASRPAARAPCGVLAVAALFLLCTVRPASAHNYLNNPSRATVASVTKPCQRRIKDDPHIQVGPNQLFELEWSQGHGESRQDYFYFVALHESDYNKLYGYNTQDLDTYLAEAPSLLTGVQWEKKHNLRSTTAHDEYSGPVAPGAPGFIARDPVMVAKAVNTKNDITQFAYKSQWLVNDKRAEYENKKFPWILGVHKFALTTADEPHTYDVARFRIPNRKGSGNYIMHFSWRGYYDCVDVHVAPAVVPDAQRYGTLVGGASKFMKMDHCEFRYIRFIQTKCVNMGTANSAKECLDLCNKMGDGGMESDKGGCTAVQAVRKTNPPFTLPRAPSIPTKKYFDDGASGAAVRKPSDPCPNPCQCMQIHQREASCATPEPQCPASVKDGPGDYICYGFKPFRHQDKQVEEDFEVTNDPLDPKYYSTCWLKVKNGGFTNYPVPAKEKPEWALDENICLSCKFRNEIQSAADDIAPDWLSGLKKDDQCHKCD